MSEVKKKRDWVRIVLDLTVPGIVGLLLWAGALLWKMSEAQVNLNASQKAFASTIEGIQASRRQSEQRLGEMELWKAATDGNRFTSDDGMELWRELQTLKEYVIALPLGEPPIWFLNRVDALDDRIRVLENRNAK